MWLTLVILMVTQLVDKVSRHEDAWQRGGEGTYEQAKELKDSPSLRLSGRD
jgi:hypothetical protein